MSSYSSNQQNDAVSCPQCGGTGNITETGASGVTMQAQCGLCQGSGTVTKKQERSYYDRKTPAAKAPVSEEEIIKMEEKARKNSSSEGGVTCPLCKGQGVSADPKTGYIGSCRMCANRGMVSKETAKIWRTR